MVELQTIFVYLTLFFLVYIFYKKYSVTGMMIYIFAAAISYAIIFGLRYGVGADFFAYKNGYESCLLGVDSYVAHTEKGFYFLTQLIASSDLHYGFYFGIIAFIQFFVVSLAFTNERFVYPYLAFTFIIGCEWLSYCNGLRQILAVCLFILSLQYLVRRRLIVCYFLILLAISFHRSSLLLVLFPILFLKKEEWFKSVKLQLFLLSFALILMKINYVQNMIEIMENVLTYTGYDNYLKGDNTEDVINTNAIRFGIGFYLTLITNFIIVLYSKKMKYYFQSHYLNVIYNLFFIGVFLKYAFINSRLVDRINYYFFGFYFIVAAYLLSFLYEKNKKVFYLMVFLFILTFIGTMYKMDSNTALYIFNFQPDFFSLKVF